MHSGRREGHSWGSPSNSTGNNASNSSGSRPQAAPAAPQAPGPVGVGNPLTVLEAALGLQNRFVLIPAIMGMSATQVPTLYIMLAAIVCLLSGLKGAIALVVIYFIYKHSQTNRH
jgi:hypothetical protein